MYPLNSDWAGLRYNISQGDYIKSLVEDYARRTIFDRESIYYKSIIRDFETFVNTENENKQRLLLTLATGERFLVKPYQKPKKT